jgi:hypothetical protein
MPSVERLIYGARNEENGLIKIGISIWPENRAKQLSYSVRAPVSIIGAAPGTFSDEKTIHFRLEDSLVKNEWFRPTKSVLEFVDSLPPYDGQKVGVMFPGMLYKKRLMDVLVSAAQRHSISLDEIAEECALRVDMKIYEMHNVVPSLHAVCDLHRALSRICGKHTFPTRKELEAQ